MIVAGPRRLPSWINAFDEATSVLSSPSIFRKWAGIAALSATLERRVWARTKGSDLYPNLYVVLVGPPGIGKSTVLSQVERMLHSTEQVHVSPSSLTTAALTDALADAKRKIIRPQEDPSFIEYNSLAVIASELGVFLPTYDNAFMNSLTKFYDGETYSERRRSRDLKILIQHPQLTLLGGTTPSYLNNFMPEGAWDQGFASRTIFVFSGQKVATDVFPDESKYDRVGGLYKDLIHDLKSVASLYGTIRWNDDTMSSLSTWNSLGGPPEPEHPKLLHYNTRRVGHLIKLCIIASISRSNEMVVRLEDYQLALDWLIEAESFMPDIFKSMVSGGDSKAIEDTWFYIYTLYNKKNRSPIPEHQVINFLKERLPAHSVMRVLEIMVRSGMLERKLNGSGLGEYHPRKPVEH